MPPSVSAYEAGIYTLPLFETSDTHGYLAETFGKNCQYRLAYICDKIKDIRGRGDAYRSDLALLLDGGDIYQGYALSNLLGGQSLAAAYELMDYDAVTIGNHEFDWGIENTVQSDRTMIDSALDGAADGTGSAPQSGTDGETGRQDPEDGGEPTENDTESGYGDFF